jgi:exopolysaccharide biosynthesis operon protein EpsL
VAVVGIAALVMMVSNDEGRAEFVDGDVVKFNLGAGVAYDDNVFRLPPNEPVLPSSGSTKRSDTIFTLNAGAAVNKDISRQNFELGGNIIQRLYTEHNEFDVTLFNFGATWNWRVGNQWGGEIGYTQNQYPNAFLEVSSFTPNKRTVGIPFASIGYQFHPSWEVRGQYQFVDITNSAERFKLSDLEQSVYQGALRYRTQFGNVVDLYYKYTDGKRPNVVVDLAGTGQFTQDDFGLGVVRWELSGRSRFSGFLAYTNRSYELAPERDFSGPTWNLTYVYLPTGTTSVSLSLYRLIGAFTDVTTNYIVTTGVTLTPTWQATSRLALGLNAFYQDRDYKGRPGILTDLAGEDQRNDDLYSVGINATYAILRSLKGTLYYTWTERDSNVERRNFRDNIVGAGLEWSF